MRGIENTSDVLQRTTLIFVYSYHFPELFYRYQCNSYLKLLKILVNLFLYPLVLLGLEMNQAD